MTTDRHLELPEQGHCSCSVPWNQAAAQIRLHREDADVSRLLLREAYSTLQNILYRIYYLDGGLVLISWLPFKPLLWMEPMDITCIRPEKKEKSSSRITVTTAGVLFYGAHMVNLDNPFTYEKILTWGLSLQKRRKWIRAGSVQKRD